MAEKNKGKFNIVDVIVIAVIIILIAGAAYKFRGLDKTKKSVAMEPITYEMTIESLRDYNKENTLKGETVEAPVENRYDAVLTLSANATNDDGVYFVDKTYEISVNSKRKIYTKYAECTAVITGVNE